MLDMTAEVRGGSTRAFVRWWSPMHATISSTWSRHTSNSLIATAQRAWRGGSGARPKLSEGSVEPKLLQYSGYIEGQPSFPHSPFGPGLSGQSSEQSHCPRFRFLCALFLPALIASASFIPARVPANSREHLAASGAASTGVTPSRTRQKRYD